MVCSVNSDERGRPREYYCILLIIQKVWLSSVVGLMRLIEYPRNTVHT
jgi:hypothetical protein